MLYLIGMKINTNGGKRKTFTFNLKVMLITIILILEGLTYYSKYVVRNIPEFQNIQNIPQKKIDDKQVIIKKIAEAFPNHKETMIAIAIEESNLNPKAVGYNCRYKLGGSTFDTLTRRNIDLSNITKEKKAGYISTFCRKGDEKYAWSKDGSLFQINNPTSKDLTVNGSIKKAQEKLNTQGLNAWTSYSTGRYKKHLAEANALLREIE